MTIRIIRAGLPSFDQAEYEVTYDETLPVSNTIIDLQAQDPLAGVSCFFLQTIAKVL